MRTQPPISRRAFMRGLAGAAGAAGGAALLAACAVPAAPAPSAAPAAGSAGAAAEAVTLEAWFDPWGPPEMWTQLWGEIQDQHGITVNHTSMPFSDIETKFLTAVAGGAGPDLLQGHPMFVATFAYKQVILDYNPYIEQDQFDLSAFYPGAVSTLNYLGKQYGLPAQYVYTLYYYNKDLVEAAGLEDPYELWKAGNWNLETFINYGDTLAQGEGDSQTFSFSEPPKTLRLQISFLFAFGGQVWSDDLKQVVLNSPEAIQGWDIVADHVRKGWSPAAAGRDQNYNQTMQPLFNGGKLGFFLNHRGFASTIDPTAINPGMVPYPVWPVGKSISRSIGQGFITYNQTAHPDETWTFMKFMATRGNEVQLGNAASNPLSPDVMDSEDWVNALESWEKNDVYKEAAATAIPDKLPPGFNEQDAVAQAAYDEIALGQKSAQEAMDAAQAKMQELLDEYA